MLKTINNKLENNKKKQDSQWDENYEVFRN